MLVGVSGPLAVPLALVLHRVGESVVAYLERLGLRAAVGDGVIEGERLGGGIFERAVVVDRGKLLIAEAPHVVDAPVDTLVRRERVSDPVGERSSNSAVVSGRHYPWRWGGSDRRI